MDEVEHRLRREKAMLFAIPPFIGVLAVAHWIERSWWPMRSGLEKWALLPVLALVIILLAWAQVRFAALYYRAQRAAIVIFFTNAVLYLLAAGNVWRSDNEVESKTVLLTVGALSFVAVSFICFRYYRTAPQR